MTRSRRGLRAVVLSAAVGVLCLAGTSSAVAGSHWSRNEALQVSSVAIPNAPGADSQDEAVRQQWSTARSIRADGVGTASTTCDGCVAEALTVQVVHASRARSLTVNNVATAWSSACQGCRASALSLQIVVSRKAGTVAAANRALAVNAGCANCTTIAVAVQIVVISPSVRGLSDDALGQIEAMLELQVQKPSGAAPSSGGPVKVSPRAVQQNLAPSLDRIQSIAAADLGATSATHDVQVRTQ